MNKKTKQNHGWMILNARNQIEVSKLIGKIVLNVERNKYLTKQKIRISKKALDEAYDLLEKKAQRMRRI